MLKKVLVKRDCLLVNFANHDSSFGSDVVRYIFQSKGKESQILGEVDFIIAPFESESIVFEGKKVVDIP